MYGIFILNMQVFSALVIEDKTIAEFAITFEKVYRTSSIAMKLMSMKIEEYKDGRHQ